MRKYAFIGGYDKTELLLFLAKIMTLSGKKVLVIDATVPQKARYIVPTMTPAQKYITTFENIDVAIGFPSLQEIEMHVGKKDLPYDVAFIDIDSARAYANFRIQPLDMHCLVTSFDLYSIKKGLMVLSRIQNQTQPQVTKIYFSKDMLQEEDDYIMKISQNFKIIWNDEIIYFPYERGDRTVLNNNQRFNKIKIRGLSKEYLEALAYVAVLNLGLSDSEVKKAMKIMEKD